MLRANFVLGLVLCGVASAFGADEATRMIDFTVVLVDDGVSVVDDILCPPNKDNGKRPCETGLTFGRAAYYALRYPEQGIGWDESQRRDELAQKIRNAKAWPLTISERDTLKKAMPRIWPPAVIGAVAKILDPAAK